MEVAKLGFLLLRTLSKPIANTCKERAKQSPIFRKYICLPPAYFYNWCEVKTKMWILNLGQPVQVPPLNEAMAIELGANLLGEGILFTVAAAVLIIEYARQSAKQAAKDKEQEEEMNRLHTTIRDLNFQMESQQAQIKGLFRHVYELDSKVVKLPWTLGQKQNIDEIIEKKIEKPDKIDNSDVITEAITYLFSDILGGDNFT
ncbi:conserved hypothetical protein [Pediculus humanus corporis]|uniref:OPA3-like protein CG13603 n=1 Tax=Pediculus humanus subsp. corporis TaxID=121224 RepID=E0VYJ0_PEDHC|nr:uncharacterized protein Phum_PHUM515090 [Pediculus humanus corporis]EEB18446.1 conserved hypothetical protein [Pediculus humanus corporis]